MKLIKCDFYLNWPNSIEVKNLRKFIIKNLIKKGEIIRWSINEIEDLEDSIKAKKLRINPILAI